MKQPYAALYARQSKSDADELEAGKSLSSANQLRKGEAYCQLHGFTPLLELSRSCVDLDMSGGAKQRDRRKGTRSWEKRSGLVRLLEAAKAGEFTHLICYDLNRLGGNDVELHLIREAFEDAGVTIHIIEQGIRTDTDAGRMLFGIMAQFAYQRLKDISTANRDNARTRVLEGRHHGSPPAWIDLLPSFATTPEQLAIEVAVRGPRGTAGWYKLNDEKSVALQQMIRLRLEGLSYSQVAFKLNKANILTLTGTKWTVSRVNFLLSKDNRLRMRGASIYGRGENRIVTSNIFPPLFGDETETIMDALDSIQSAYRCHSLMPVHRPGNGSGINEANRLFTKTAFTLSGLIYCHICGARLRGTHVHEKQKLYTCTGAATNGVPHPNRQNHPEGVRQNGMSIGGGLVEDAARYALLALARHLREIDWKPPKPSKVNTSEKMGKSVMQSIEAITYKIDALMDLNLSGKLKTEDFERKYAALVDQRQEIEKRYHVEETQSDQTQSLLSLQMATASSDLTPDDLTPEMIRLLLVQLVSRAEVPVIIPGLHRGGTKSADGRLRDLEHLRLYLNAPLTDGTTSILAAMYRPTYKGEHRVVLESASSN